MNLAWYAPMLQLTILRLCHVPIDQCLYLLFHCPNLIEFHCSALRTDTRIIFAPEVIFSPSRTPKICPNLRIFHWKAEDEDWNRFLFSSIRFPNLEKLSWGVPYDSLRQPQSTEPIDSVLINEFIPSLSRITALDWDIPPPSRTCFNEVFSRTDLSSLQRLYISLPNQAQVLSWLKALTIGQRHVKCSLPQLQNIHIETPYVQLGKPLVFESLYKCLRSRFPLEDDGKSGATHRRRDIITFVHYWKFLLGRAPSVLINVKKTPSKFLLLVVFILILLQHPRTVKSSRSDRCNSVIDLLPFTTIKSQLIQDPLYDKIRALEPVSYFRKPSFSFLWKIE